MRESIKKYLPYFQFGAVVVTIVLGVHTALDRFVKPSGVPVRFIEDSFSVTPVHKHGHEGHWEVKYKKFHPRKDCKVVEEVNYIVDSAGFKYEVKTTVKKSADGQPVVNLKEINEFAFHFAIHDEDAKEAIKQGVNRFGTTKVFKCTDGDQVIEFPQVPGLMFSVPKHHEKKEK